MCIITIRPTFSHLQEATNGHVDTESRGEGVSNDGAQLRASGNKGLFDSRSHFN